MKYKPSEATWLKGEEFWCDCCDAYRVHSDKPDSGTFYSQFGHQWKGDGQKKMGKSLQIIFALCPQCDPWR